MPIVLHAYLYSKTIVQIYNIFIKNKTPLSIVNYQLSIINYPLK